MTTFYEFDRKVDTAHYEVQIDTPACYGYFEHHTRGDLDGGGLWFERLEGGVLALIDYDGVFSLPAEVKDALRGMGFIVDEEF